MSDRAALLKRIGLVAVVVLVLASTIYQVNEPQQVIVTQFGDPVGGPVTTPGLHLKVPFIQTANYFDKRFLEYESKSSEIPTKDKRYLRVSVFARWRVSDPLRFFERVRDESGAQARLDDILAGEVRNAIARYDLIELVRSTNRSKENVSMETQGETVILDQLAKGRPSLAREVLDRASARAADLGIAVLDVRFKRISYVEEVQKAVFARMIAERQQMAQQFISEGQGAAARIGGERDRDLARITSEAYRSAEQARGKADADATRIYAEANGRDPDFYAFVKSLETYEKSFDPNTVMILDSSSDLLKFLGKPR